MTIGHSDFPRKLARRGLRGVKLVVSDAPAQNLEANLRVLCARSQCAVA
jgi:hypothetical protein